MSNVDGFGEGAESALAGGLVECGGVYWGGVCRDAGPGAIFLSARTQEDAGEVVGTYRCQLGTWHLALGTWHDVKKNEKEFAREAERQSASKMC